MDKNTTIKEDNSCIDPEIFAEKVSDEFLCPIKLRVMNNPVSCPNCGVCYCKECLTTWVRQKSNCPSCRKSVVEGKIGGVILPLKRQIQALRVRCSNEGCAWIDKLENLQIHLKLCEYTKSKCEFCKEIIPQKLLENHLKVNCLMGLVDCQHCKAAMQRRDLAPHLQNCVVAEEKCAMCENNFSRGDLSRHLTELCEQRVSDCVLGCGAKGLKVKDLAKHYYSSHELDFVNKLASSYRQEKENELLKQKLTNLDVNLEVEAKKGASSDNVKKAFGKKIFSEDLHPLTFTSMDSFLWIRKNLVDESTHTLEMIHYQAAPELSIEGFHKDCDSVRAPSVFVVKTEGGNIIGAYSNVSFGNNPGGDDPKAILFSATHKRKFVSRGETKILKSENQGPSIHDALLIFDKSKTNISIIKKNLVSLFQMEEFLGKEELLVGKPCTELKNFFTFKISHLMVFIVKPI